jgi:CO dehydrogenase nickel-insertion accessory protein CooC1
MDVYKLPALDEPEVLDLKIGMFGKGGTGKSAIISLLARYYAVDAYDADPLEGLRTLLPAAKKYDGTGVTEPSLIEFPLLERGFRMAARDPDIKVVLVTTPHVHAVMATMGILETLHRYCPNEVKGLIINQGMKSLGEGIAEKLGLELLGAVPLEPKLDDHLIKREDIAGYEPSARMVKALGELAEKLDLKVRDGNGKGGKWSSFVEGVRLWRT